MTEQVDLIGSVAKSVSLQGTLTAQIALTGQLHEGSGGQPDIATAADIQLIFEQGDNDQ